MPTADFQGAAAPFSLLGRSILSIRRDQVHSMESPRHDAGGGGGGGGALDQELDCFQRHVADLFHDLAGGGGGGGGGAGEDLLSLAWIWKLLEAFLVCHEEFRAIILNNRALVSRPPLDRMVAEFCDRCIKALDVCNAIRGGIDQVRQYRKHLEIVVIALDPSQRTFGEGHLRRAKKALTELTVAMLDEKEASGSAGSTQRNRSFGRNNNSAGRDHQRLLPGVQFRSLSWSVSRSWSAARQLLAIANNLAAPRGNEVVATSGLAVLLYTMNTVLLFVMWALVAAIPCQDRGLQTHFAVPKSFPWAAPMMLLHERIVEESKKKDRRNSNGLLKEIHGIERCSRHLAELTDPGQYPLGLEREMELRQWVEELSQVCDSLKDGLDQLERQVREVFHRIIRNRTDGLDCLVQAAS